MRNLDYFTKKGEFSLDHLKELVVRHFDVPGHVPGEVDHGNNGFDALQFVPLVTLHCQLVLMGCGQKSRDHFHQFCVSRQSP